MFEMNMKKKISLMLHGAGFVAINTACICTILGLDLPGDTFWLAGGILTWVWSDALEKA